MLKKEHQHRMVKNMDKTTIMQIKKWKRSTGGYQKNSSHKSNRTRTKIIMFTHLFWNSFPTSSLSLTKSETE